MTEARERGKNDFLQRRGEEEMFKFGKKIVSEAIHWCETHFILAEDQMKTVVDLFVETIDDLSKNLEFSADFKIDGDLQVQVHDSDVWRMIINLFKNKLKDANVMPPENIERLYSYLVQSSSHLCFLENQNRIGVDRMP